MSPAALLAESLGAPLAPRERRDRLRRSRLGPAEVEALLAEARVWRRKNPEVAGRIARSALAVARAGREPALAADAAHVLGQAQILLGRPRHALRVLRRAMPDARPDLRPALALEEATSLSLLGLLDDARASLADARRLAGRRGQASVRAVADLSEANLLARVDREAEALALLDRARAVLARRKQRTAVASIDVNRANALANVHRYAAAERLYGRSVRRFRRDGQEASALQAEYNRAYLHFLRGEFHRAIDEVGRVRERFDALGDERHVALCDLDMAEMYLRLNLPGPASRRAAAAAEVLGTLGIAADAARARFFEAAAARGSSWTAGVRARLDAALEGFRRADSRVWEAVCLHRLAEVEREDGNLTTALARADAAAKALGALGQVERGGRADVLAARIETTLDRPEAALARLRALDQRTRGLHAPWLRCEAFREASRAEGALGRTRAALGDALRAARLLERHRVAVPPDECMAAFLRDKASIHEEAIRLVLRVGGRRSVDVAYRLAQQAKGRALSDLLHRLRSGRGRVRPLAGEAERVVREIDALLGRMPPTEAGRRGGPALRCASQAKSLEARLEDCLREMDARDPRAARESLPTPATARAALSSGGALVEYFVDPDGILAFVLDEGGVSLDRLPLSPSRARVLAGLLRFHMDRPPRFDEACGDRVATPIVEATRAVLGELHAGLVEPLEGRLGSGRLVVVPHGVLHGLPFHAFATSPASPSLDREVVVAPSTSAWLHCLRAPVRRRGTVVVYAVPDEAAPEIGEEARAVAALHPGAVLRIGAAATRSAFAADVRRAALVHVACHADWRPDDPMLSSLRLADGPFTISDAYRVRMSPTVLVLSGCSTGRSAVTEGDELFGVPRGFLRAGASNLLTSLWTVGDRATRAYMTLFHRRLCGGDSPAAAARSAADAVRRDRPDPREWAAFCLLGSGGAALETPVRRTRRNP